MAEISRYARYKFIEDATGTVGTGGEWIARIAMVRPEEAGAEPSFAAPEGPLAIAPTANAISLTTAGTAYTQDFDSLANTGTSNTNFNNTLAIPGFTISESGGGPRDNEQYAVDTGASGTGDIYSYGSTGSTDRALGGLQSGTLVPTISAEFANNTGAAITSLAISYTGEQWRVGTANRADRLDFQYSLDGTTWIDVDELDFIAPVGTATGARDGNAAANRAAVSFTITGLDIPVGEAFLVRYNSFDASGADDGLAIDDFSLTANPPAPPPPPAGPGAFSISDATVLEGDGGTTPITFTVTRPEGSVGVVTVDYTLVTGTAAGQASDADFDGMTSPSGTLTFGDGVTTQTLTFNVVGEMSVEPNEIFSVTLANATGGATIADGTGTGSIIDDDAPLTAIFTIQGEGHLSAFAGQSLTTSGVVTAVANNGFYMQDPTGDGNLNTSDGIFVFTSTVPSVTVGQAVRVAGSVSEFQPGGAASNNLSVTQITPTSVAVTGTGTVAPTVIGTGGRLPPTRVFEDDNFTVTDIANDGLDFYESLEGMLVTIDNPLVVAERNSNDEVFVLASEGAGATGVNSRGGITVLEDDFNPERIQLDDTLLPGFNFAVTQGDVLADVTGVVSYNFQSYEVLFTQAPVITRDAPPPPLEATTLRGSADRLSVASYNVENLAAVDPQTKFDQLGVDIAQRLGAPDIIGLSEVQDADGAGMGADTSGQATADKLIAAIIAAGGPAYQYVEIAPPANSTGGEPGGNIRNGFLYNPARVDYVEGSALVVTGPAYDDTRKPLVADFVFNGEVVTVIDVHFTSRGGSDGLAGATQPPNNEGDDRREAQAATLRAFIDQRQAANAEANIITLGDFNAFYFEPALENLQNGPGGLSNLYQLLSPEERYTFLFDGNLQPLDNILVSSNLLSGAEIDVVHINAEQPASVLRPTDHDPVVATVRITANDTLSGTAGNDTLRSGAGNDFFFVQQGGDDTVSGGSGDDAFYFGAELTAADIVDGGEGGNDQLGIQGDYTGARAVTLGAITNVEVFLLLSGDDARFGDTANNSYSYDVTTTDQNVVAGGTLTVDANRLRPGENVVFDGAAETDGSFFVFGGQGIDSYTGGAQNDVFLFREVRGFTADDRVNGGGGALDQLGLQGDYTGANAVTFGVNTLVNVEGIVVISGRDTRFGRDRGTSNSFDLTLNDANVVAGQQFTVDAGTLRPDETLTFNGAAETDGRFRIFGGDGDDVITGGQGIDSIRGGLGNDTVNHNAATAGSDAVDLGAGTDIVRVDGGGFTQIRLTFTSSEVGNGSGNRTTDGLGNVAFQGENTDGTLVGGGAVSRFDDEGIVFVANGNERFDVRDTGGAARGEQFEVVVLGTSAGETLDSVQFTRSYYINGGLGDDTINGGLVRDFLVGGAGNDRLTGGFGGDSYLGGGGNDVFVIAAEGDSFGAEADTILDFMKGADLIDLSGIDADNNTAGVDDAFAFIGSAAFGNMAGQLRTDVDSGGRMFVEGDTNGDGVADFTLFVVTAPAGQPLVVTDFIL